jgi:anaerobic magnesium-protoporphyrin IX monomethyl ester cyclase
MRVALLYAPPWKIRSANESDPAYGSEGAPPEYKDGDLDADFFQVPYGLLSLGAQAIRAGHSVKVINISSFPWTEVEAVLDKLDADLYGLSVWTANRRGVGYVCAALKKRRPNVPILVGGPHATPFAEQMLHYHPAIDLVAVGESDDTLLEVLQCLERGEPLRNLRGTVYRDGNEVCRAPERPQRRNLDELACVHQYFGTHILMTSRGCPWACTFCGAETSWGRGFRSNSVARVADAIESALARLPVRMIQIKDDTFTTHKKRVFELCSEIRRRKLSFLWSCDTRVDMLSADLLREMRLAGCQRLSLGVESGSQRILDAIDKKITVDEIVATTQLAKKYGIKVRHYMMLGNRGETKETFAETLAFLERARPHEYVFSCLSIYPGTPDFEDATLTDAAGRRKLAVPAFGQRWLDSAIYFTEAFQELKTPFDADAETTEMLNEWFRDHNGLQTLHVPDFEETKATAHALGEPYHAAEMDIAAACYRKGEINKARAHVEKALALGYPLPGLCYNHLACFAYAEGDLDGMMKHFSHASEVDPQHYVLIQNVVRARQWFRSGGYDRREPLELTVRHDFQLLERTMQPTLPGPLSEDFELWTDVDRPRCASPSILKTPEQEGSRGEMKPRLRILE